ncbi:MAG: hypothetical protein IJD33_02695, partial [Clostridia bacterium]|nr:hypothetical protein [Clostridia bacterium]
ATPSEARTVAYVADEALLDADGGYSDDQKTALGNILEKSIMLENNITDEYVLSVNTLETAELSPLFSGLNATDITFTPEDKTVATVDEDGVLTALQTAGNTLVNVSAYGGKVNFDISVKTTAVKGEITNMFTGSSSVYTYATYGAKVGNVKEDSVLKKPALEDVEFGIGSVSEGSTMDNMGTTNFPYVALGQTLNAGGTGLGATNGTVIEFTGNNMPIISFWVADDSESAPMENVVKQKGITVTNGFTLDGNLYTGTCSSLTRFLTIHGFTQFGTKLGAAGSEGDYARLYADTHRTNATYADVEAQRVNISYKALEAAGDTQKYRLFIKPNYAETTATDTGVVTGEVTMQIVLYTVDADGYNENLVYVLNKTASCAVGTTSWKNNAKGNIVIYGRPYETTKLDKIHFTQTGAVSATSALVTKFNKPAA